MSTYVVRKGDTLGKIAKQFYGDASRYPLIVAVDRTPDPHRLTAGRENARLRKAEGGLDLTFIYSPLSCASPTLQQIGARGLNLGGQTIKESTLMNARSPDGPLQLTAALGVGRG